MSSNHVELESAPCGDEQNDSVVIVKCSALSLLHKPPRANRCAPPAAGLKLKREREITLPETAEDSLKYRTTPGNPTKYHLLVSLKSDELIFLPEEIDR